MSKFVSSNSGVRSRFFRGDRLGGDRPRGDRLRGDRLRGGSAFALLGLTVVGFAAACSSDASPSTGTPPIGTMPPPAAPAEMPGASGGAGAVTPGAPAESDPILTLPDVPIDETMPEGAPAIVLDNLVATESGGYQLGEAYDEAAASDPTGEGEMPNGEDCGDILVGVVRDFREASEADGHPDFETFGGGDITTGLVAEDLGADAKPVYASQCGTADFMAGAPPETVCPHGQQTTTQANFDQWYRAAPGVNQSFRVFFQFEPAGDTLVFHSQEFYPVDGAGFADSFEGFEGGMHNFHFTTELHTKFKYAGGEVFTFIGDDDVWVYINGKLALDLGGLHPTVEGSVDLDTIALSHGLVPEGIYALDLFHAERHTNASRFRIETSLSFVDCGGPAVPR